MFVVGSKEKEQLQSACSIYIKHFPVFNFKAAMVFVAAVSSPADFDSIRVNGSYQIYVLYEIYILS